MRASHRRRAVASSGEEPAVEAGAIASPHCARSGRRRRTPGGRARSGSCASTNCSASCAVSSRAPATNTATTASAKVAAARPAATTTPASARLGDHRGCARSRACRRSSGRGWRGSSRLRGRCRRSWSSRARTGRCTTEDRGVSGPTSTGGTGAAHGEGHRLRRYTRFCVSSGHDPAGQLQDPGQQLVADEPGTSAGSARSQRPGEAISDSVSGPRTRRTVPRSAVGRCRPASRSRSSSGRK